MLSGLRPLTARLKSISISTFNSSHCLNTAHRELNTGLFLGPLKTRLESPKPLKTTMSGSNTANRRISLLKTHLSSSSAGSKGASLGTNPTRSQGGSSSRSPTSPRSPSTKRTFSTSTILASNSNSTPGSDPQLSPSVRKILHQNESHSTTLHPARHGVLSFHSNSIAANATCEDSCSFQLEPIKETTDNGLARAYFTVTDGHLGPDTAQVVARYLPSYIAGEIAKIPSSGDAAERLEAKAEAITRAFTRLDGDIVNGGIPGLLAKQPQSLALQGACCVTAILDPENNGVFVGGAGDCRAVLGKKSASGGWEMVEMSRDHTLRDESEVGRLKEEHPDESVDVLGSGGRVLGVLMPSRAFGDADFKWKQEEQKVLGSIPFPSSVYRTPPYMTAEPDVFFLPYGDPSQPPAEPGTVPPPPQSFLILATDGLWDFMTSSGAVATIASLIESGTDFGKVNPATVLIRDALSGGSKDPRAVKRLEQLLQIPPGRARNFRDDVTVLVVFLGGQNGGWASEYAMDVDVARVEDDGQKGEEGMVEVDLGLAGEKEWKVGEWVKVVGAKKSAL